MSDSKRFAGVDDEDLHDIVEAALFPHSGVFDKDGPRHDVASCRYCIAGAALVELTGRYNAVLLALHQTRREFARNALSQDTERGSR